MAKVCVCRRSNPDAAKQCQCGLDLPTVTPKRLDRVHSGPLGDADALLKQAKAQFQANHTSLVFSRKLGRGGVTAATLFNRNVCIGEVHSHVSPKRFLIESMAKLKERGFEYLFFEHILSDVFGEKVQPSLDVLLYLQQLDIGHELAGDYTFTRVFAEAVKQGITVIAFDTKLSYLHYKFSEGIDRTAVMNYLAALAIDKYCPKKELWVALVGNTHVHERTEGKVTVPGIVDQNLTATSLWITDDAGVNSYTITLDDNVDVGGGEQFRVDIHAHVKPGQSIKLGAAPFF